MEGETGQESRLMFTEKDDYFVHASLDCTRLHS